MSKRTLMTIGNIKIPLFIPKRSKGHIEVVGIGEVLTYKDINSYDCIKIFIL